MAKSIQTCASLKSQIETQRIEFERILRIEVTRACELFGQQGRTKLDALKSRLNSLSSRVSSSSIIVCRRKTCNDVTTQTVRNDTSNNDMTTQTPRIERKDDVRVPTEPTPFAASTTQTMTPKKRIEWIDNDLRYSVEDRDDVVVDVFKPKPSSLSFKTPPRVRRSKNLDFRNDDDDDEDVPEMITPKILRKSASIPCDSPETEAELFRKLQDISTRSDPLFTAAPSTPTKVQSLSTTCYPEQLSPAQTVALMERVLRVSIPYTTTSKEEDPEDESAVTRAFQLGMSVSRSSQGVLVGNKVSRRTYNFV